MIPLTFFVRLTIRLFYKYFSITAAMPRMQLHALLEVFVLPNSIWLEVSKKKSIWQ
jgi:hypothetical protein